jgi:hypothetical protein
MMEPQDAPRQENREFFLRPKIRPYFLILGGISSYSLSIF